MPEGIARVVRDVGSRKDRRVRHHIVIRWRPGLPRERDGPWFLMTDREGHAEAVCGLSARRMGVEERFRDPKGRRNGWAMRDTRIQHVERFLLILALAYILRAGLGLRARLDFEPSAWCTNRRARECSALTIGKAKLHRVNYLPDDLLRMVRWATIQVAVKWG